MLPKLTPLLLDYPDIKIEFDINYGFRDIVADRFDAGVRMGDTIDKDMVAVPIGPQLRMAAAASPMYFGKASNAQKSTGPAKAQLYQSAYANSRGAIRLGV